MLTFFRVPFLLGTCSFALALAAPVVAQTYTYSPNLPEGVESATVDGQSLQPDKTVAVASSRPTIGGRITTGAAAVVVSVGSTTVTAQPGADGSFSVTLSGDLAAGEHAVFFDGARVGAIAVPGTPVAPGTGSAGLLSRGGISGRALLSIVAAIAAATIVGAYALGRRPARP